MKRLLRGIAESLAGLFLVVLGIAAFSVVPVWILGTALGLGLLVFGAVVCFHGVFYMGGADERPEAERGPSLDLSPKETVTAQSSGPSVTAALASHSSELENVPPGHRRAAVLLTWRDAIDEHAHDYADLVVAHSRREKILEVEVAAMMGAYLAGYAAGIGWVDVVLAEQEAYRIGRALRNELRSIGIRLEELTLTIGTVMDGALRDIVKLGAVDGRSA